MSDAETLYKAMKGLGTDEDTIVKVVGNRTNDQRLKIKEDFKSAYGKDLVEELKSELSGKMKDAMIDLFKEPIEYDVDSLYKAVHGAGTDVDTLIEILVTRDIETIKKINELFLQKYKDTLENKIISDTSGTLRNLFVSLLQCKRSTNTNPDVLTCQRAAKEIYAAGEGKTGTDDEVFNKYFTSMSPDELITMGRCYNKLYGHSILDAIDHEFSGNIKKALTSIIYASISPSQYFAIKLYEAMKGAGTDDSVLMRVIFTRCEVDMGRIKQFYKKLYQKDLAENIKSEISGNYRKLILELISH